MEETTGSQKTRYKCCNMDVAEEMDEARSSTTIKAMTVGDDTVVIMSFGSVNASVT